VPAAPVPVAADPTPSPAAPVPAGHKQARVAAVVIGLAAVGYFVMLFAPWAVGDQDLNGPPGNALLAAGAASYLLPVVVMLVGGFLMWTKGPTPLALGAATGAAGASFVVMSQYAAALRFLAPDRGPSANFWVAFACPVVALLAALHAFWHAPEEPGGSKKYAGWLVRLLATAVVVATMVVLHMVAGQVEVAPMPSHQLATSLTLALVLGLLVSFLALPPRRRRTLLAAVTTLCVLVVLSDVQSGAWWYQEKGRAKWQAIDAVAFTVVLLVTWAVQGRGFTRSGRDEPGPDVGS
jgi:hypothetical protein